MTIYLIHINLYKSKSGRVKSSIFFLKEEKADLKFIFSKHYEKKKQHLINFLIHPYIQQISIDLDLCDKANMVYTLMNLMCYWERK